MTLSAGRQTPGSDLGEIQDLVEEDDFILVKMNVPHEYEFGPGFPSSHGNSTHAKRMLNHDLAIINNTKADKNAMSHSDGEFATVTVNLISQPNRIEDESHNDEKEHSMADDNEVSDELKEEEEELDDDDEEKNTEELLHETESDNSEDETTVQPKPTCVHSVTLVPLELPNISLPCSKCVLRVNICHVRSHRDFHYALQMFKFAQDYRPLSVKMLIKRRKLLIKRLQESSAEDSGKGFADNTLQKINTAFEILKSELKGTGNRIQETNLDPKIRNVYGMELSCTMAVGLCDESNSKWKNMEDAHAFQDQFLDGIDSCFVGIYDGYCGNATAQKCSRFLHVFLKEKLQDIITEDSFKLSSSKEKVASAFKQAYYQFQKMLVRTTEDEEQSRSRWSGCSALTCLLTAELCCLANAGTVGALLVRGNAVVRVLTSKHDLYNKKERDRVRRSKGVIVKTEKCALINGALGTTRGLGNIGDMGLNNCIINAPKFKCVELLAGDQLIVLASSGLWKMFSYEETTNLVFGFFRKIKQDLRDGILYGDRIPNVQEDGRLENENEDIYERLRNREEYFLQFLRPQNSRHSDRSLTTPSFLVYQSFEPEKEIPTIRVVLKIPWWKNNFRRRMSDTCLSYQGNCSHGNTAGGDIGSDDSRVFDNHENDTSEAPLSPHGSPQRRHSLPDRVGLRKLHKYLKTDFVLTQKDKEKLLARFLARRLVKSAMLAGSLDNITVFVILLPGFSLVNVHTLNLKLLEQLERPMLLGH